MRKTFVFKRSPRFGCAWCRAAHHLELPGRLEIGAVGADVPLRGRSAREVACMVKIDTFKHVCMQSAFSRTSKAGTPTYGTCLHLQARNSGLNQHLWPQCAHPSSSNAGSRHMGRNRPFSAANARRSRAWQPHTRRALSRTHSGGHRGLHSASACRYSCRRRGRWHTAQHQSSSK